MRRRSSLPLVSGPTRPSAASPTAFWYALMAWLVTYARDSHPHACYSAPKESCVKRGRVENVSRAPERQVLGGRSPEGGRRDQVKAAGDDAVDDAVDDARGPHVEVAGPSRTIQAPRESYLGPGLILHRSGIIDLRS